MFSSSFFVLYSIVLLLVGPNSYAAETSKCTICGTVSATEGWFLPGVKVEVSIGVVAIYTVTSNDGKFLISDLVPGRYDVEFTRTGYSSRFFKQILCSDENGRRFTIDLKSETSPSDPWIVIEQTPGVDPRVHGDYDGCTPFLSVKQKQIE